ncbi:ABC transporter ATP-binding protein [Priestia flexa]|uniref:ABC transporter ATP-binding protein n=1 Tax=Priestia flexa TaxID=86664 RepID=UPI0024900917|nr:ABC transporter ATP-binding protein [Priestia flexa]
MNPNNISLKDIIKTFKYWPRIFNLFWKTSKTYFIIISSIHLVQAILPVLSLLAIQRLVNNLQIFENDEYSPILKAFFLFLLIELLKVLTEVSQDYFQNIFQTLFSNKLNIMVMEKADSLSLVDFEDAKIQDQLKRAQNEAGTRPYKILVQILALITSMITLCSSIIIIFSWKWWVALILVIVPLSFSFSFFKISRLQFQIQWNRIPKWRKSWYLTYLMTHDNAFKEIKTYDIGNYLIGEYRNILNKFYHEDAELYKKQSLISLFFEIISLIIIGLILFLIVWETYLKKILIGNLVSYIQAVNLVHKNTYTMVTGLVSLCEDNLFIEQLFLFLDLKSLGKSNKVNLEVKKICNVESIETIEFKNVYFKYRGSSKYSLKNVNLKLSKGESLAIVGDNGAGKSTLVKLLTQLYEDYEGQILVNDLPIECYEKGAWKSKLAVLFQDFMKYEQPFRHNIGFGGIDFIDRDEDLYTAADNAGIKDLIEKLPNKIDTQLGKWFEDGYQLSGGQWQKVAIARTYMRSAEVYIFDEPSSALDPYAEIETYVNFRKVIKNKIGIFIAHRFSSIRFVDKIIVMKNGEVIEQGNHEELLNNKGVYHELYNLQASSYKQLKVT